MAKNIEIEKIEQKKRGDRIRKIRETELNMNKTQLGREIGISGQFLSLVEEGKGNLAYHSIRKLRDISGHSADYILFGIDDNIIDETRKCLEKYSEDEIIDAIKIIKNIAIFMKKSK